MNAATVLAVCLFVGGLVSAVPCRGDEGDRSKAAPERAESNASAPRLDPTLEKLAGLVGGTWVNVPKDPSKAMVLELRYEMALGGRAVRAIGVLGKGRPDAVHTEAIFAWDPVKKSVYYFDFHGPETVYKGTIKAVGNTLESEFETVVGPPAQFRSTVELVDKDTLIFTVYGKKDGQWVELHKIHMKRRLEP